MSTKILVSFATQYGSTKEVAERITSTLRDNGIETDLRPLRDVQTLNEYNAVIIGTPLMMYSFHKDMHGFLKRYHQALISLPVAVFVLGPVHDPHDEKEWQGSKTQLEKELVKFPWFKPIDIKLFGGRFDPKLLQFPMNKLAGPEPATDIRDWEEISVWAETLAKKFTQSK